MDSHGRLVTRLLVVSTALVLSVISGGLIAAYGAFLTPRPEVDSIWLRDPTEIFAARKLPFTLLLAGTLTQVITIWKLALVGIVASEFFTIRSWVFQAANGAACGYLAAQLFRLGLAPGLPVASPDNMLTAGLVGGLTYWAVAGWNAGFHPPASFPSPTA